METYRHNSQEYQGVRFINVVDNKNIKTYEVLRQLFKNAVQINICVAFISIDGIELLKDSIVAFLQNGGLLNLLISEENEQKDLESLLSLMKEFSSFVAKIYPTREHFMHSKFYCFNLFQEVKVLVGSSNFTEGGLMNNVEHNVLISIPAHRYFQSEWFKTFKSLWEKSVSLSDIDLKTFSLHTLNEKIQENMQEDQKEKPVLPGQKVIVYGQVGEVLKVEDIGNSRKRYTIWFDSLNRKEVYTSPPTSIQPILGPLEALSYGKIDPEIKFDLLSEAYRLSLAYEYDRMVSISSSRINLEPYQVEAVYSVINSFPHRYLIADDTGLGKTIETGMILEELAARGRAERVLIVAPAPICKQWHEEMKKAFGKHYIIYDGPYLRNLMRKLPPEQNPWMRENKIITSLDLAKQDYVISQLQRTTWDVVIFDEAHKLSARKYGNKVEETQRYRLAKILADKTDSLIFLSATPHNGNRYSFYALLSLLDPFAFPNEEMLESRNISRITIRRTKKEILNEEGKPVFVNREVMTLPVRFTETEEKLYEAVTEYVREGYNLSQEENNRAVGFVMVLFQKRMVSSIEAIRRSLVRRVDALKKALSSKVELTLPPGLLKELHDYIEDPDSIEDAERERLEKQIEVIPFKDVKRIKWEIKELEELIEKANSVEIDSKSDSVFEFLENLFRENPSEKVIIFTEYRDTLEYLEDQVKKRGWSYSVIHGGMNMEKRKRAQAEFEEEDTRILLATDAAGEGLNLHWKCHLMINYELPWNPNRIEQRIGRLHRYGQKRDVKVYNLCIEDSREDLILTKLLYKLNLIQADLPGDVYDVLGVLLQDVDLREVIVHALRTNEEPEATSDKILKAAQERAKMLERLEKELLLDTKKYDHERALRLVKRVQRVSVTPRDIEEFTKTFLTLYGAKIKPLDEPRIYSIKDIPLFLVNQNVRTSYERVTFDKEVAKQYRPEELDFIAFGHPLFDSIMKYCRGKETGFGGLCAVKHVSLPNLMRRSGILFNFLLRFTDGREKPVNEEIIPVFVDENGYIVQDVVKRIPKFEIIDQNAKITEGIPQIAQKAQDLFSEALQYVKQMAKEKEDIIQEQRSKRVKILREDLEKYASTKESILLFRKQNLIETINELKAKLNSETLREEERRAVEGTLRLRTYDLEQVEKELENLKKKVQERSEELENMEIIVAEEPQLLNLAIIDTKEV